jgi:hypothetical protein
MRVLLHRIPEKYVIFATQDVADVARSPLKTTIIQQCLTKIYLADPSALTPGMTEVYRSFGLSDSEIGLIANSTMKRDYFYTSPAGRRLFQLDLGPLSLSLIGTPDHALLDELASRYETGEALCAQILDAKKIPFRKLLDNNAPVEPEPVLRTKPLPYISAPEALPGEPDLEANIIPDEKTPKIAELLEAVESLPERKKKRRLRTRRRRYFTAIRRQPGGYLPNPQSVKTRQPGTGRFFAPGGNSG